MIKWFARISMLLIFVPFLLSAKIKISNFNFNANNLTGIPRYTHILTDTIKKKQPQDDKNKIKEVAKAKKQPKPEKIETGNNTEAAKKKLKRQRRPEGLERPPEIPRRNGN